MMLWVCAGMCSGKHCPLLLEWKHLPSHVLSAVWLSFYITALEQTLYFFILWISVSSLLLFEHYVPVILLFWSIRIMISSQTGPIFTSLKSLINSKQKRPANPSNSSTACHFITGLWHANQSIYNACEFCFLLTHVS